jgi:hypothetical protein
MSCAEPAGWRSGCAVVNGRIVDAMPLRVIKYRGAHPNGTSLYLEPFT